MNKDLIYTPEIITTECFSCKEKFKLFSVQKIGLDFCKQCGVNNRLVELITLPSILKKIVLYAEKENKKLDDNLIVDVSNLIKELQGTDENNIY